MPQVRRASVFRIGAEQVKGVEIYKGVAPVAGLRNHLPMLREIHEDFDFNAHAVDPETIGKVNIKVVGVGGGGSNAVNRMYETPIETVDYIAMNTDAQVLEIATVPNVLRVGDQIARGMGVGGDPKVGKLCHEENRREITELLNGADLVFVTAGMGGGTGTGGAPVVASIARQLGALTIGVVTRPFSFEGTQRKKKALEGIEELSKEVDTLVTIPNDLLLGASDSNTSATEAWKMADQVLQDGVEGIAKVILEPGEVNVDFADVKTVMSNAGPAWMGVGRGVDTGRAGEGALDAVTMALESPLLDVDITGAKSALVNITGGAEMTLHGVQEITELVKSKMSPDANIILGTARNDSMKRDIQVVVIATGFPTAEEQSMMDTDLIDRAIENPESVDLPPFVRRREEMNRRRSRF